MAMPGLLRHPEEIPKGWSRRARISYHREVRLRCDLHVNGDDRKLVLVPRASETDEHTAMKLAAFLLFWAADPIVEAGAQHPALLGQEFIPDLMGLDLSGFLSLWVECGKISMHKLDKLYRRFPAARIVIVKATPREAERLRRDIAGEVAHPERVSVVAFPDGSFREWMSALREKVEVYGEASEHSLNLVVNEMAFVADLGSH